MHSSAKPLFILTIVSAHGFSNLTKIKFETDLLTHNKMKSWKHCTVNKYHTHVLHTYKENLFKGVIKSI